MRNRLEQCRGFILAKVHCRTEKAAPTVFRKRGDCAFSEPNVLAQRTTPLSSIPRKWSTGEVMNCLHACVSSLGQGGWDSTQGGEWAGTREGCTRPEHPFLGGEQLPAMLLGGQLSLVLHCWDGRRRSRGQGPLSRADSSLKSLCLKPFLSEWNQLTLTCAL